MKAFLALALLGLAAGCAPMNRNAFDEWQHKQDNPAWRSPWPEDGTGNIDQLLFW